MKPNDRITPQHILAISKLNQRLGDFVCEAFRGEHNPHRLNLDLLMGHIAHRTLADLDRSMMSDSRVTHKSFKTQDDDASLQSFAYGRYAKFVACHSVPVVSATPVADVGLLGKQQMQSLLEEHPTPSIAQLALIDADDRVKEVWNQSRKNRRTALQRVGALYFLSSEINGFLPADSKEKLNVELNQASRYLFNRASDFRESELKFAIILGGTALKLTRDDVVRDSFGSGMSVCQYFSRDENLPGSFDRAPSDELLKQIHAYAAIAP